MPDKDTANTLLEYLGYAICDTKYRFHKALVMVGSGANGKSTLIKVLKTIVGKTNYSVAPVSEVGKETVRLGIVTKMLNFTEETPNSGLIDGHIFKEMTSGGEVEVRGLYKMGYKAVNRAKFILSCNELPYNRDFTNGMRRRLILMEFPRQFTEQEMDRTLDEKLGQEASGILNLLIAKYKQLMARGSFVTTEPMRKIESEYIEEMDSVAYYMSDMVEATGNDEDYLIVKDMYADYVSLCLRDGIKNPVSKIHFGKRLGRYNHQSGIKKINGEVHRVYSGLKSKVENKESDI
jgi:putative DNA primase/helicase